MNSYFLTRLEARSSSGSFSGLWPEEPSVVAGFSNLTTFYADDGRDSQSQFVSISGPSVTFYDGSCYAAASATLSTDGGVIAMQGGDRRTWNWFTATVSHYATFRSVAVSGPTAVTGRFEFYASGGVISTGVPGSTPIRNYKITLYYGTSSITAASGSFVSNLPVEVSVSVNLPSGLGEVNVYFVVETSYVSGGYTGSIATEYVLFQGGEITAAGASSLASNSMFLLAIGR